MDVIIEQVGVFGIYQALLYSSILSGVASCVMGMLFMVYGSYNPGWTCENGLNNTGNLLNSTHYNLSQKLRRCDIWRQCDNVIYSSESSTIITEWNLDCDSSYITSLTITIQMVGVLVGAVVSGFVGDAFGRKVGLFGCVGIHVVANLACGLSNSWHVFVAFRFLIGSAIGGILTIGYCYPYEFVGGWWRAVITSVPTWGIGLVLLSLVSYLLKDWRQIHLAIAVISGLSFLNVFWAPESIRWLALRGKFKDVESIVNRMASWNGKPPVDLSLLHNTVTRLYTYQRNSSNPRYIDLFKTATIRKYSIQFGVTWLIVALIYYMLSFGISSFSGDFYLNLVMFSLVEIPGNLLVAPLANKFGRRLSAVGLFCTVAAFTGGVLIVTATVEASVANKISVVLAILAKSLVNCAWMVIVLMSAELYPTVIRNLHSGYLNTVARIGGMLSPLMIPKNNTEVIIYYSACVVLLLIAAILMYCVPESNKNPMEDVIRENELKPFPTDESNRH